MNNETSGGMWQPSAPQPGAHSREHNITIIIIIQRTDGPTSAQRWTNHNNEQQQQQEQIVNKSNLKGLESKDGGRVGGKEIELYPAGQQQQISQLMVAQCESKSRAE